jgi:hypothetical protein
MKTAMLVVALSASLHAQAEPPTSFKFKAAHAALFTLAAVDAVQSQSCLSGGHCREVSPIYRPFAHSPEGFMLAKLALTGAASATLWHMRKDHPRAAVVWTVVAIGFQGAVIGSNAYQLRRAR